jgi:hypothetical protein
VAVPCIAIQGQEILKRPLLFSDFISNSDAEKYYQGSSGESANLKGLPPSATVWKIWCAEEDAPFFPGPVASRPIGKLNFKEALFVMGTEVTPSPNGGNEHWLQVARESNINKPAGWVRANSVILSPWALKTSGGVGRKALVVPGLGAGEVTNNSLARMQIYQHQKVRASDAIPGNLAKKFRILYILRETERSYLLATSPSLEGGNSKAAIVGWMPKENAQEWERRVAYGPAFGTTPNLTFTDKSIPLFDKQSDALEYTNSCNKTKSSASLKIEEWERIPQVPAYPFIGESSYDPNDPLRELLTIQGFSMSVDNSDIENKRLIDELQAQLSNIHVYFIVDATASMRKYYPDIAESIKSLSNQFNALSEGEQVKLEVGFGVYRDYKDGPLAWQTIARQAYDDNLANAIENVDCRSLNPNNSEAVYNGILGCIDDFNVDVQASNIVILIGDEGNHAFDEKGLTAQTVQDKLIEMNASLFVFQSTSYMTESSNRFQKDALGWIHAVAEVSKSSVKQIEQGVVGISPQENGSETVLGEPRQAKLITPTKGTGIPASPSEMAGVIFKDVKEWTDKVFRRLEGLSQISQGPTYESEEAREKDILGFMERFGKTREEAERFFGRGGDLAIPRHCSIEHCNGPSDVKVLVPYVFLSQVDFIRISNSFNDLASKGAVSQQKDALETMCRNIILTQVGSPEELSKYEKKTMNEIWLEFFQVDFNIPELRDVKLDEIKTVEAGFGDAYDALMRAKDKWQLMDISEREWEIASTRNQKFYWVPASKFPGFAN